MKLKGVISSTPFKSLNNVLQFLCFAFLYDT